MDYGKHVSGGALVTTSHRVDPRQVKNNSGGYVFAISPVERLERFLILGTEGGTYYQGEKEITVENAVALRELLDTEPALAVKTIVEVSQWGRAPKQAPGIFALAISASHQTGKDPLLARALALNALPLVCRTGGTLLEFVRYVDGMRGRGTALRRAVGAWYRQLPADQLFWQTFKYRSRGVGAKGTASRRAWTHRDVLRVARPKNDCFDHAQQSIVRYLMGGSQAMSGRVLTRRADDWSPENDVRVLRRRETDLGGVPEKILAFEELQAAETETAAVRVLERYGFPHEMVPDRYKKSPRVWEALLEKITLGALLRNLGLITHLGLIGDQDPAARERLMKVLGKLQDLSLIRKSRIHPVAFLQASRVYGHGEPVEAKKYQHRMKWSEELGRKVVVGVREILRWDPVPEVVKTLENDFYKAFGNVQPAGKRIDLCIDISGSMSSGEVVGIPKMTPREGAAAMALVQAQTETSASFWGFCDTFRKLEIDKTWSIAEAMRYMSQLPMDRTDCSLPFREAQASGRQVDGFVVYTDSETNQNLEHPCLALWRYRQVTGIPARLAVMAFTSTGFSIADPTDGGMMDFVGFDAAAPSLLADFLRGRRVPRKTGELVEEES